MTKATWVFAVCVFGFLSPAALAQADEIHPTAPDEKMTSGDTSKIGVPKPETGTQSADVKGPDVLTIGLTAAGGALAGGAVSSAALGATIAMAFLAPSFASPMSGILLLTLPLPVLGAILALYLLPFKHFRLPSILGAGTGTVVGAISVGVVAGSITAFIWYLPFIISGKNPGLTQLWAIGFTSIAGLAGGAIGSVIGAGLGAMGGDALGRELESESE